MELIDTHALPPIYAARSDNMLLLSDDLRYRQLAHAIAEVPGIWLQAALASASAEGAADRERVARGCALAARRHDHLRLNANILLDIYRLVGADLREFDTVTDFIGSQTADMRSHTLVVYHFLAGLWLDSKGDLRSQRATGMILDKLLRFRTANWYIWLGLLMLGTKMEIGLYIAAWLRATFPGGTPRGGDASLADQISPAEVRRRILVGLADRPVNGPLSPPALIGAGYAQACHVARPELR